jgi:LmbE family N-acetylglucosaminyl deacetylase
MSADRSNDQAGYVRGRVQAMADALRHLFHRHVVELPDTRRPLFVAPHPDDIVIGCGGTLWKLVEAGIPARLIYLTDGRAAATDPSRQEEMAATRAREARAVSQELGLPEPLLLNWDETTLHDPKRFPERASELGRQIARLEPDAIFLPYLFDQHSDHRLCNHLLARALEKVTARPRVFGYEVWSLCPPGLVVDISAQLDRKLALIELYRSQLELFPYPRMIDAIGRAHASLFGPDCVAAEVFCPFRADAFIELVASLGLDHPDTLGGEVLSTPPDTW